jgi:protein-ribulosamine 3-kinase
LTATFLEEALRDALSDPSLRITGQRALAGGCIHEAACLLTTSGELFAKWSADAPADIFLREAEGLEALRAAAGEGIVVPRVLAVAPVRDDAPGYLVLEFLPPAPRPEAGHDEQLGRGLAAIHRATGPHFGFPGPSYCGLTAQDNTPADTWVGFFRERRLLALVRRFDERGDLDPADLQLYDRLSAKLTDLLPPGAPPSLIHGDLWSGNVFASARGPALVDPACAWADREMELGITTLFGGLSARALAAYEEAWPLPSGWRERNGLYQLYHLLNHAVLFGGGYAAQARRTARRYAG